MNRSIGSPAISRKGVLANGLKMRAIGRSAATAIGERRSLFGAAKMGDCIVDWQHRGTGKADRRKRSTDLHRHFIDDLTFQERWKDLYDGSLRCSIAGSNRDRCPMRKIITHLRIKKRLKESFPADFIAEGLDQTRGWFYTLTVLSAALFQKAGF